MLFHFMEKSNANRIIQIKIHPLIIKLGADLHKDKIHNKER